MCLYYVIGWLLILQFGDAVYSGLGFGTDYPARHIFYAAIIGFPICFALSWHLQITPRGIARATTFVERRVLKNIDPINDRRHSRTEVEQAEIEQQFRWILIAETGPLAGLRFGVKESVLVGRSLECDLAIVTPNVSRRHARLETDGDCLYVEDLESAKGTAVNGEKITERKVLQNKDELRLHDVIFRVQENPQT